MRYVLLLRGVNVGGRHRVPMSELQGLLTSSYPFHIPFALIPAEDYLADAATLPDWWRDGSMGRRDVLFYSITLGREVVEPGISRMGLGDEVVHFGRVATFWGKGSEERFLRTAYHRLLIREPYYKEVTIRNGNTFDRIAETLSCAKR